MKEISSKYVPSEVEDKWYGHWKKKGYFHSEPDQREPYSIVIPPPNVTGILHMGHMLNNTVQDMLARKARLDGKNVCWVPGTDHASIATEAKVVKMLREQGIKKSDLSRDEFLEYAMKWKEKYGGIILKQLEKLGASCDWERTAFTMDKIRSESVIQAFCDLYERGTLYRDYRIVNWDPEAQTVLSNEEVIYTEENGSLYHIKYKIEGSSDEYITIATTRPETIMGDSAIAVHPDDPKYAEMKGKRALVPIINRSIPIIFDDYVELDFGSGALKVTPAHDINDYEIGKRHNLETIDVLNANGTISEAGEILVGMDRFKARKAILPMLEEIGQLVKTKDYVKSVGRSERTNSIVEPRLSLQWYVEMKALAQPALDAVENDEVTFFPKNQKNLYRHWMENIRDWCVSRQLWWGHRIPAYYYNEDVYVAATSEGALAKAKKDHPNITIDDLKQDEDVLDTWCSSWLWPITCFQGFHSREEMDYYYPTSVLVTGWDIIFLWVARMIMAGYEWEGKRPFKDVYFTGMVKDEKRRKMSKSLGNSPDALKLIDDFGADGVRFGIMSSSPAGGDLLFDKKLCEQGRNFSNKIWNALRLVKGWEEIDVAQPAENKLAIFWISQKLNEIIASVESDFKQYRLSEATMTLYNFIWNDFCSWYLEMIKPPYGEGIDLKSLQSTVELFEKMVIILHPLMPFLTEEIYHLLKERSDGDDCIISSYPNIIAVDKSLLKSMVGIQSIIGKVRDVRASNGLKQKEELTLLVESEQDVDQLYKTEGAIEMIEKLAFLAAFKSTQSLPHDGVSFMADNRKFFIPLELEINIEEEIDKIKKEISYADGFLKSVEKKLSNDNFVNGAPDHVVANEKKKQVDGIERLKILNESLKKIKS
ncbi:MAG: valine--tRNA ligase [Saprospiraceae bacterium]